MHFDLLVPIISYAGAVILVNMNMEASWVAVIGCFYADCCRSVVWIAVPHLYANLMVTGILILVGYAA